ncbi:MAG: helix-turn-helix transcriptional regulator [Hyphomicrobiaceae bacterium]|nr:helix-turn-helix transcriptional regulator [Hyphomicrobiaceae bacterium]
MSGKIGAASKAVAVVTSKPAADDLDRSYLLRVGENVRQARARRGMTRKLLAQASGVSERYLADLETGSGNASLLVLKKIALALDLDVGDLVRDTPEPSVELALIVQQLERLGADDLVAARRLLTERFDGVVAQAQRRVALIGLRGAGKTTLGAKAAQQLGVPFIELDREIERAAGMELAEIFALQGQANFRALEYQCLKAVIERFDGAVIATGGSLVTSPKAYDLLLSYCHVVWLKAAPQTHMERVVAQGDMRPMADNPQAMDDLKAILDSRSALYSKANAALDTTGRPLESALSELLAILPMDIASGI